MRLSPLFWTSLINNLNFLGEAEDTDLSFTVSTILPGFLFLGPEPSTWDHVEELKGLGVRRIVNLAMECGPDDWGLGLDSAASHPTTTKGETVGEKELEAGTDADKEKGSGFEKYFKIPMRDTVEEDGIGKGVRMVCQILGALFFPDSRNVGVNTTDWKPS